MPPKDDDFVVGLTRPIIQKSISIDDPKRALSNRSCIEIEPRPMNPYVTYLPVKSDEYDLDLYIGPVPWMLQRFGQKLHIWCFRQVAAQGAPSDIFMFPLSSSSAVQLDGVNRTFESFWRHYNF